MDCSEVAAHGFQKKACGLRGVPGHLWVQWKCSKSDQVAVDIEVSNVQLANDTIFFCSYVAQAVLPGVRYTGLYPHACSMLLKAYMHFAYYDSKEELEMAI